MSHSLARRFAFLDLCLSGLLLFPTGRAAAATVPVYGDIVDTVTGRPLAARLYLQRDDGSWHFAKSVAPFGSAVRYEKRNAGNTNSVEFHTTLSAHMWVAEMPPGRYTAIAERGKEFFPLTNQFTVGDAPMTLRQPLRRWVDMAGRGWFSGDTHAHRNPSELSNVMLAEDVNVTFPLVYWTQGSTVPPTASDKNFKGEHGSQPVRIDATHYWNPHNTEYEIFRVGAKAHTLGAVLILNHRSAFDLTVFPLAPVLAKARAEGALLDMEKHNWPWSMVILPLLGLDLFELSNNHVWRTEYAFRKWGLPAPPWMKLTGDGGENERDWVSYGLQTYYALLNCGFRMQPCGGTANGVHPVPLGFSRVYVHMPSGFSYEQWLKGLAAGRTFVTTGPMLTTRVNGEVAGYPFRATGKSAFRIQGEALSEQPLTRLEVVVNGEVVRELKPANIPQSTGAFASPLQATVELNGSGWIVIRCFEERADGRFRFAHTAPWWIEIPGHPLRPKQEHADWFVKRVEEEVARNTGVIPEAGLAEFKQALEAWRKIAATGR